MKKGFILFSSLNHRVMVLAAVIGLLFQGGSVSIRARTVKLPYDASGSGGKAKFAANTESKQSEKLTNQDCMDCHNPDILKLSKEDLAAQVVVEKKTPVLLQPKPLYVFGELNVAIKKKQYEEGVHADTTCVACHGDVTALPHPYPLKRVDCKECHEKAGDSGLKASAHKAVPCIGCHDVHYGKRMSVYAKDFQRKVCLDCHTKYGMEPAKAHQILRGDISEHFESMDCMDCHQGDQPGVHNIPPAKKNKAGETEGMEQEGPPWGKGPPWREGPHW